MKWYPNKRSLLLLLLAIGYAAGAMADDYHYVNNLVGNRAAGLGGAYTALADDPAGCFYNPAGIAMAPSESISASMNAYNHSRKVYQKTLRDTSGRWLSWEQESSSLQPNFFGIVKQLGQGVLGLSYAVPDTIQRRQKQDFNNIRSIYAGNSVDDFIINIDDTDDTYLFGPSYARRLSENLAIGATFYLYYRDREIIRNQVLRFELGDHYWINYYETQNDLGYRPMVGVIWEPWDKVALGLTISKIIVSSSDRKMQTVLRDSSSPTPVVIDGGTYDFSDTDTLYVSNVKSNRTDDFPLTTSLGLTYFASSRLLFTADCVYHAAIEEKLAVTNFSLGSEYYLRDNLALRGGIFTDMANTPNLSASTVNGPEHVDIYGINLSLTLFQRQSSITLGAAYGMGNGKAQMISGSSAIQDVEIQNYSIFLAASYSF